MSISAAPMLSAPRTTGVSPVAGDWRTGSWPFCSTPWRWTLNLVDEQRLGVRAGEDLDGVARVGRGQGVADEGRTSGRRRRSGWREPSGHPATRPAARTGPACGRGEGRGRQELTQADRSMGVLVVWQRHQVWKRTRRAGATVAASVRVEVASFEQAARPAESRRAGRGGSLQLRSCSSCRSCSSPSYSAPWSPCRSGRWRRSRSACSPCCCSGGCSPGRSRCRRPCARTRPSRTESR